MGKTVLLTSYTHSAVDNILLKFSTIGVEYLRLGAYGKMHPSIRTQMLDMRANLKTYSDLKDYYDRIKVVATTAMGFNHMLFTKKRFDYCIIDESSQMALPFCLTPLNLVDKFVLVGDQYQLSPLFAQKAANPAYSLFEHLSAAHPISVSKLSIQYRMNEDIMQLANELVYDNRLKCNAEKVRYSSLDTPKATCFLNKLHQSSNCIPSGCWISHLLEPQNRVIFFDTDALAAQEQKIGSWIENPMELKLVVSAVEALVGSGVLETDIGIISPYKYQLKLLRLALNMTHPKIELLTVDQFQGRDKKVILISFVRSNPQKLCGDLVRDWRRVNVAVTRAERKLVLIGSQNTLSESCSFQTLFKLFKEKKWVIFC